MLARGRRGSVALISAGALVVLLGFGALAIDVAYMRLAQAQCQDVADAASVAALWALRQTGDEAEAQAAAEAVIANNVVAGENPTLTSIEFGDWDPAGRVLMEDGETPNAVSVTVGRRGGNSVSLFLGQLWGHGSISVSGQATAAARNLHVVLVMDITNSWQRPDYYNAREAAVAFYDTIEGTHGPFDKVGMTVFTGRYAWEFTPMTLLDDAQDDGSVRAQWVAMETASKAGRDASNSRGCDLHSGDMKNDFSDPEGGCFPDMPREYRDEPGTDHTTGLEMARQMFQEEDDETAYRALVVLTDGYPNGIGSRHGETRDDEGWQEPWREWRGPVPHSTSEVKSESVSIAAEMWEDDEVHTWVVSFVADDAFMENMTNGDGYYVNTSDSGALVDIFETIASSLPLAIVD